MPWLVLAGSGGLADFLSDVLEHLSLVPAVQSSGEGDSDAGPSVDLKDRVAERVKRHFPSETSDIDKLVERVSAAGQNQEVTSHMPSITIMQYFGSSNFSFGGNKSGRHTYLHPRNEKIFFKNIFVHICLYKNTFYICFYQKSEIDNKICGLPIYLKCLSLVLHHIQTFDFCQSASTFIWLQVFCVHSISMSVYCLRLME